MSASSYVESCGISKTVNHRMITMYLVRAVCAAVEHGSTLYHDLVGGDNWTHI